MDPDETARMRRLIWIHAGRNRLKSNALQGSRSKYLKLEPSVGACMQKTASELLKGREKSAGVSQPTVAKLSELLKGRKRGVTQPTVTKLQHISGRKYGRTDERKKMIEKLKTRKPSNFKQEAKGVKVFTVVPLLKSEQSRSKVNLLAKRVSEDKWRKEVSKINSVLCQNRGNTDDNTGDNVQTTSSSTNINKGNFDNVKTALNTVTIQPLDMEVDETACSNDKDSKVDCNRKNNYYTSYIENYLQRNVRRNIHTALRGDDSVDDKFDADYNEEEEEEEEEYGIDIDPDYDNNGLDDEDEEKGEDDANALRKEISSNVKRSSDLNKQEHSNPAEQNDDIESLERERESAIILCEMSIGKGHVFENSNIVKETRSGNTDSSRQLKQILRKDTPINLNEATVETIGKGIAEKEGSDETSKCRSSQSKTKNEQDKNNCITVNNRSVSVNTDVEISRSMQKNRVLSTKAKIQSKDAEVCFAQVGKSAKIWTQEHPQIKGIYLNKGKREVKKSLVSLKRLPTAIDKGSYMRNGRINDKNRIDDGFVFTEEGQMRRDLFEEGKVRDEYVVNWYMWCPGHGNCERKCNGFGKCVEGCAGSRHKQDRHNCSLMINWKLYLSDLDKWRIQITGSHVPIGIDWILPKGEKERLDEDTRDLILECSRKSTDDVEIKELIAQKQKFASPRSVPSCQRIKRFRKNRIYKEMARDQRVRETLILKENNIDHDPTGGIEGNIDCSVQMGLGNDNCSAKGNEQLPADDNDCEEQISVEVVKDEAEQWESVEENVVGNDGSVVSYYGDTSGTYYTDTTNDNQLDQGVLHEAYASQNNLSKPAQQLLPVEIMNSNSSPQLGFVAGSAQSNVPECGSEMEMMADSISPQIHSVPQVQTVMNALPVLVGSDVNGPVLVGSDANGPLLVGSDANGQPCYSNYGEIAFYVCSQDSNMQGQ